MSGGKNAVVSAQPAVGRSALVVVKRGNNRCPAQTKADHEKISNNRTCSSSWSDFLCPVPGLTVVKARFLSGARAPRKRPRAGHCDVDEVAIVTQRAGAKANNTHHLSRATRAPHSCVRSTDQRWRTTKLPAGPDQDETTSRCS